LPRRDHLPGINQGRGDDATAVGKKRGVGKRIAGEVDRAFGAVEARACLVSGGLGRIELGVGGPTLGAKVLGALLGRTRLRQHASRGTEFGLRLLGLQFEIDLIEGCQRLVDINGLADVDQAAGDLAGHAETHVGLDPGFDRADKASFGRFRLIMHCGDQDWPARGCLFSDGIIATGQADGDRRQR
jgi:hypothetical protein